MSFTLRRLFYNDVFYDVLTTTLTFQRFTTKRARRTPPFPDLTMTIFHVWFEVTSMKFFLVVFSDSHYTFGIEKHLKQKKVRKIFVNNDRNGAGPSKFLFLIYYILGDKFQTVGLRQAWKRWSTSLHLDKEWLTIRSKKS